MAYVFKRNFDNRTFIGDVFDYNPPKPQLKMTEISVIRGASRYQNMGQSKTEVTFSFRFYSKADRADFLKGLDKLHSFTDEDGTTYTGVMTKPPEMKKIGEYGMYEAQKITLNSMDIMGDKL